MIFHLGRLPEYDDFILDSTWQPFEQNGGAIWMWQLKALPIALFNVAVILGIWIILTPVESILKDISYPLPILEALMSLVGVLIVHELLHAIVHPGGGVSNQTVFGFWPSKMFLYTSYGQALTRNRYLTILLAPLIVISSIPITISIVTGYISIWMVYFTVLNAFVACGDVLAVWIIMKLPNNTIIRNKGESAYWKVLEPVK